MASRGQDTNNDRNWRSDGVSNSVPPLIDFGDDASWGFGSSKTEQTPIASNSIDFILLEEQKFRSGEHPFDDLFDCDTLNLNFSADQKYFFEKPASTVVFGSPQDTLDLLSDVGSSVPVLSSKTKTSTSAASLAEFGLDDMYLHQDNVFGSCSSDSLSSRYTNPFENSPSETKGNNISETSSEPRLSSGDPFLEQSWTGIEKLSISQENQYPILDSTENYGNGVSISSKKAPDCSAIQQDGPRVGYEDCQQNFDDLKQNAQGTTIYSSKTAINGFSHRQNCNNGNQIRRNKDSANVNGPSIDEFIASGEGKGVFRVPIRGAIRPERPAFLELRPHPLRETQDGQTICTIISTGSRLWAGLESGIRFWDIEKSYSIGRQSASILGDEDTAPFVSLHVQSSPTTCLVADTVRNIVWSGHRDGNVRGWPIDASNDAVSSIVTWQAHPGPVLSMVVTPYGELWTGSEFGSIRAWACEAFENALSNIVENYRNAVYLMEGCYIDLRSRLTSINASILSTDIRLLTFNHSNGTIWSAGSYSLVLWDSKARDVLKVFGLDGPVEFLNPDFSQGSEIPSESQMKLNFSKVFKKEKIQGSLSFFQRSKNALLGAADAVCRATLGGQLLDDGRKIQAMVASADGTVWTGHANGLLVHWDHEGNQLQEFQNTSVGIHCLWNCGTRLWIGYADGRVQVIEHNGKVSKGWLAHNSTVLQMAMGSGHVFTLAVNGGIRGWNLAILSPLASIIRTKLIDMEPDYTRKEQIKVLAGTWNVSQGKASFDSLRWLASPASEANIVVVGLQEIEMGAGVLAMAAAKETVGIEGSANGQWWLDSIGDVIDEERLFVRVGSRQLAGLLIGAWVRRDLLPFVGDVDVGAVACGFGRALGNKGAVAIKMRVFRRTMCIINSHFAAHMDAVARRNADFDYVYRSMTFGHVPANSVPAGVSSAVQIFRGVNTTGLASQELMPELAQADMIIWLGDLNYRLNDISYKDAIDYIKQKDFETLVKQDQLRQEMRAGRVFQGMREGQINFPPTYKFDRGQQGPLGYDSSEKRRVPAWCDRILFRDSRSGKSTKCKLSCPIVSSIEWYDTCMDIMESDHKPVMGMFNIDIAFIDEANRREKYGHLINSINTTL